MNQSRTEAQPIPSGEYFPGKYRKKWEYLLGDNGQREDYRDGSAFAQLLDLATMDDPTFWYLKEYFTSPDPMSQRFYGRDPLSRIEAVQRCFSGRMNKSGVVITYGLQGSQKEAKLNEDALLIQTLGESQLLVADLDGATSQKPIAALSRFGVSGAFHVSHLASLGFPRSEAFRSLVNQQDISAEKVMIVLNDWLKQQLSGVEGVDYNDVLTIPGMSATMVLIDLRTFTVSWAHVADTIGAIGQIRRSPEFERVTDNRNASFDSASLAVAAQVQTEKGIPLNEAVLDARVKDSLKAAGQRKINTPEGTGILNGMQEMVDHNLVQSGTEELNDRSGKILLASDGYYTSFGAFDPRQTPEKMWKEIRDDSVFGPPTGPVSPFESAWKKFHDDPSFVKYPRFKPQDDKSFIAVNVWDNLQKQPGVLGQWIKLTTELYTH